MARPSEDDLIAAFFAPIAGKAGLGLADDAACVVPPEGQDLVLSTDTVSAGVHFFAEDPPAAIAAKALRVNLSDLAAKAAAPLGFLLNLALPEDWTAGWLETFAAALGAEARDHACPLIGGDTVKIRGPLTLSITIFGSVPHGRMVRRAGARAGDILYASGTIGDAALGLLLHGHGEKPQWTRALSDAARGTLVERYLYPQPRLALREALRDHARAAMDISDGLAGDLAKMLHLTGMTADLSLADVPLSAAAREALGLAPDLAAVILSGGDDYEVLAAVSPGQATAFETMAASAGVPVAPIGTVRPGGEDPAIRGFDGSPLRLARRSYQHF